MSQELEMTIEKVSEYMTEAARLHIRLGGHATVDVVKIALIWRFDCSDYQAKRITEEALRLMDAMPKKG